MRVVLPDGHDSETRSPRGELVFRPLEVTSGTPMGSAYRARGCMRRSRTPTSAKTSRSPRLPTRRRAPGTPRPGGRRAGRGVRGRHLARGFRPPADAGRHAPTRHGSRRYGRHPSRSHPGTGAHHLASHADAPHRRPARKRAAGTHPLGTGAAATAGTPLVPDRARKAPRVARGWPAGRRRAYAPTRRRGDPGPAPTRTHRPASGIRRGSVPPPVRGSPGPRPPGWGCPVPSGRASGGPPRGSRPEPRRDGPSARTVRRGRAARGRR